MLIATITEMLLERTPAGVPTIAATLEVAEEGEAEALGSIRLPATRLPGDPRVGDQYRLTLEPA